AAFSIEPGTVRTAMAESALDGEAGRRWLPWFREVFDQGRGVPPGQAARLVALLASGKVDALSGRFPTVADDAVALAERVARGRSDDFRRPRLGQLVKRDGRAWSPRSRPAAGSRMNRAAVRPSPPEPVGRALESGGQ